LLLLRTILEKDVLLNHFLLIPRPTSWTKKVQTFSQISIKQHLAVI